MKTEKRIVIKPWGREIIWTDTENYVGKILEINPGGRLSLQYHQIKEESIYVIEGDLKLTLKDDELILSPGDVFHITPGTIHRFSCYGSSPVRLFEVSTNHLTDVVRLEDDYNRAP